MPKPPAIGRAWADQLDAVAAWASGLSTASIASDAVLGRLLGARASGASKPDPVAVARLAADLLDVAERHGDAPPLGRGFLAGAVRVTLHELARRHPGHLVEVRVPPWGAVQLGVPGVAQVHRRGTPPNVVECDPRTWVLLAAGVLDWDAARAAHRVSASGAHAELGDLLPLA